MSRWQKIIIIAVVTWATLASIYGNVTFTGKVVTTPQPTLGCTANAVTVNAALANVFYVTLADCTDNVTITVNGLESGESVVVIVRQDTDAARTITWAFGTGTIKWPAGTAPTLTATANHEDVFSLLYTANGSGYIYGSATQDYQD